MSDIVFDSLGRLGRMGLIGDLIKGLPVWAGLVIPGDQE